VFELELTQRPQHQTPFLRLCFGSWVACVNIVGLHWVLRYVRCVLQKRNFWQCTAT